MSEPPSLTTNSPLPLFRQISRWSEIVNSKLGTKDKFLFVEAIPNEWCPPWPKEARPDNLLLAPHWSVRPLIITRGRSYLKLTLLCDDQV